MSPSTGNLLAPAGLLLFYRWFIYYDFSFSFSESIRQHERGTLSSGSIDPCASIECPAASVCILDLERRPHCRCGDTCPSDFQPVCGSDGRSYSSQCHLMQEACRSQRHLRILYKGLCESGTTSSVHTKEPLMRFYFDTLSVIFGTDYQSAHSGWLLRPLWKRMLCLTVGYS